MSLRMNLFTFREGGLVLFVPAFGKSKGLGSFPDTQMRKWNQAYGSFRVVHVLEGKEKWMRELFGLYITL